MQSAQHIPPIAHVARGGGRQSPVATNDTQPLRGVVRSFLLTRRTAAPEWADDVTADTGVDCISSRACVWALHTKRERLHANYIELLLAERIQITTITPPAIWVLITFSQIQLEAWAPAENFPEGGRQNHRHFKKSTRFQRAVQTIVHFSARRRRKRKFLRFFATF